MTIPPRFNRLRNIPRDYIFSFRRLFEVSRENNGFDCRANPEISSFLAILGLFGNPQCPTLLDAPQQPYHRPTSKEDILILKKARFVPLALPLCKNMSLSEPTNCMVHEVCLLLSQFLLILRMAYFSVLTRH